MGEFILMPKLGMTMTEGIVGDWLVDVGSEIEIGDDIFEVETDKTTLMVDSVVKGTLLKKYRDTGDRVPVNQPVGYVGAVDEVIPELGPELEKEAYSPSPKLPQAPLAEGPAKEVTDYDYDIMVIGGGPGGYVGAIRAAQLGAKTALVERAELGGTCLNRGCIPTKALYHSANTWQRMLGAAEHGFSFEAPSFSWPDIVAEKSRKVKRLVGGVSGLLAKNQVTVIREDALVTGHHRVKAGRDYSARHLILATGSKPDKRIKSEAPLATTDDMLDLPKLPASLGIIGGGAIGCELASIFSNFGVKVKVFEYMPRILPMMDKDISHAIADALIQSGVELHAGVTVEKVSGVTPRQLHLSDGKAYSLELVLEAIGRRPETSAFDTLGLELDEHGFVKVDSNYQSSIPGIFAIGDVNGISQLAHSASNQAVAAVEFALLGEEAEHQPIPSCVFSAIEAASIGMTLESALEKGFEAAEYRFPMAANGMALSMDADQGFVKTVYDKKYGEILGVHLACQGASLMIHEAAAAIRGELTVRDAARMIHAHPTLNEALMESFLGASDGAIHV